MDLLQSTQLSLRGKEKVDEEYHVTLSTEDLQRICHPSKFSVIIKLLGKRILHQYLKRKIQELWKPIENFPIIDLSADYYIVKFNKEENMVKDLHQGPWFVNDHFLPVQRWEPNFVANESNPIFSVVWVRLPQLPTEFYDGIILEKIRNKIGRLLKIDACTSSTLRGRYARLCVEIPMEHPVKSFIYIESHKQNILYEGERFLCKNCGRQQIVMSGKVYPFPRKKQSFTHPKSAPNNASPSPGINVRIFYATTSKYLNTQKLKYVNKESLLAPDTDKKQSHISSNKAITPGSNLSQAKNKFPDHFNQPMVLENTTSKMNKKNCKNNLTTQCMQQDTLDPMELNVEPPQDCNITGIHPLERNIEIGNDMDNNPSCTNTTNSYTTLTITTTSNQSLISQSFNPSNNSAKTAIDTNNQDHLFSAEFLNSQLANEVVQVEKRVPLGSIIIDLPLSPSTMPTSSSDPYIINFNTLCNTDNTNFPTDETLAHTNSEATKKPSLKESCTNECQSLS
ncbi:uncharacterized protein [Nicotiana sylvestris]|uniref:uncharacterized protein n=1 Tax=Nicotiana sylvestris TaxID=4096 RepID=UPI00388CBF8D